ncbi:MAG TPA: arylsulfotransferase family protein [Solirubrobacteraceae bacterium]|nr:arylsulfotransferase family protein [Solirubrobacteraceae bacterium]
MGGLSRCALATAVAALALAAAASAAQAVTISPLNGTPDASPDTQISFLGVPASQIADVSVDGSRSGSHSGKLRAYVSATGASFLPSRGFTQGERVTVSAVVGPRGHAARVGTSFTIARLVNYPLPAGRTPPPAKAGANQSFVSQPQLQPPTVKVTTITPAAMPGDIFLTANGGRGQNGAMIIDGSGRMIWFQPAATGDSITNLQLSSYAGKPVLTYWQGHIDLGVGFGSDVILGPDYRAVASVQAGNGYQADLHELQLTPQGSAYLSAYTLVRADLSAVGGSTDGALQDAVVQQVDVPTGLVMFEWHAYGHVALTDSYAASPTDPNRPWDFFHLNSIEPDPWGDGNFLISSRNTWAAYEVKQSSGSILWRIGGRKPTFRMGSGTGTAFQHDARWQPDHTITIFDNGATPKAHSESRAIHEAIDFKHRTVKLLGRYVRTPPLLSGSQGDDQVLGSGDSFVGWGEDPYFTEFNAAGETVFDAHLPAPAQVYRAFRVPWNATPAAPPAVALKAAGAATTVYASWNGATNVASWQVLGGANPASLSPLATVASGGFETAVSVPSAAPVFAVQALSPSGEVLGISRSIAR